MKKVISILLVVMMVFSLAACSKPADAPAPESTPETPAATPETPAATPETPAVAGAFEGKIAIVTNTLSQNEEEYRSAQEMVEKYGADKIIHELWPDNFMTEQEQMISIITKLGSDPEVKALIINQAVPV